MEAKWYYAESGKALGPVSAEEIARRIKQGKNQPHFIWTEGMSGWMDVSSLPEFSKALQAAGPALAVKTDADKEGKAVLFPKQTTLAQRARRELIEFLVAASYLYVCFGALIFYKASILHSEGIEFPVYGLAIAKALILGKFLLMLQAFKIGEGKKNASAALAVIVKKSLFFTLLLFVLTVIEELIVGYFHGRASQEVLREFAGGTLQQALAVAVLLFLILIPYFAFQEIAARLGEGKLWKFLIERPAPENQE
jgi:hypothetical protein